MNAAAHDPTLAQLQIDRLKRWRDRASQSPLSDSEARRLFALQLQRAAGHHAPYFLKRDAR